MNTEPRFLLDEDSICYGCPEYKHVSETDIQMHLGDVDENGLDWEFSPEEIGKTVFLTREEAEKALKEMEVEICKEDLSIK